MGKIDSLDDEISDKVQDGKDIGSQQLAIDVEKLLRSYVSVYEKSNLPSLVYDIGSNKLVSVNNAIKEKFGITSSSFFNLPLYELGKEFQIRGTISKRNFEENISKAIQGDKQIFNEIFTNVHGEIFLTKITIERIPLPDNRHIIITLEDISSEIDLNSALNYLGDPERILLSNALEGISIIDPALANSIKGIKHLNTRFANILGYSLSEINEFTLFNPPISPRLQPNGLSSIEYATSQINKALNGENSKFTFQHLHKNGNKVYIEFHLRRLIYNNKPLIRASYIDITEIRNKDVENINQLFESERRYEFLLKYAPEAILIYTVPSDALEDIDDRNEVIFINEKFARMLKYTEEYLKDKILYAPPFSPEIQPNGRNSKEWVIELNNLVFQGDNPVYEWLHYNSNGEEVFCEIRLALLPFQGKTIVRGTVVDITDKKIKERELQLMQKELNHTMKMKAIGRLAGGITHNFNNILTTILGYTDFLISKSEDNEYMSVFQEIDVAAKKAATLSRQLLDFSRKQELETRNVNINSIIKSMESIILHSIDKQIEIQFYLASKLPDTLLDEFQFEQMLTNMVINASDAIKSKSESGKITISSSEIDNLKIKEKIKLFDQNCICDFILLSIEDDGVGILPEIRDNIFEPFVTSKSEGYGTGLGLSSTYSFMNNINGFIDFETESNVGTIFNLYFISSKDNDCQSKSHLSSNQEKI